MLRALVILLIGVLAGANIVYFAMTRSSRHESAATADASAKTGTIDATSDRPAGGNVASPSVAAAASTGPGSTMPASPAEPFVAIAAQPSAAASSTAPGTPASGAGSRDVAAVGPAGMVVPVSGIAADALTDTYNQARGSERRHEALDIMAPAGTPVVAAADGSIEKLFTSDKGGLTIYEFEPSGRYAYYYAHLQRYASGLAEKQQVKQGDVIGYVGSTGNADPAAPHLHFAIFELGPERQWWKGTPVNPYPFLHAP